MLDEDSVDISGVASKINHEYGINITEKKLHGILSSHRLLSGAKLAESLAPPLQINPTSVDNEVAGRLLLLNENSTMISELTEAAVTSNASANEDYPTGALSDEELPPTMKEMVHELHSPIEIMDEELLFPFVVVAEEKTKHVATPNLNDITRTTRQKLDPMVETCNPDQV